MQDSAGDSDDALVRASQQGNTEAFGQLYRRYARMVHGILLARVPLNDVDDLVQDVFLLALPRLHTLRDVNRFGAWLAAIARNRATDYHRTSVDEVELTDDLPGIGWGGAVLGKRLDMRHRLPHALRLGLPVCAQPR